MCYTRIFTLDAQIRILTWACPSSEQVTCNDENIDVGAPALNMLPVMMRILTRVPSSEQVTCNDVVTGQTYQQEPDRNVEVFLGL